MNPIFFEIFFNVQSEPSKSFIRDWTSLNYLDYGCLITLSINKVERIKNAKWMLKSIFMIFSMIYGVKKTVYWQEEWVELNNSRVHKDKDSPDIMRWQGVRLITISPIRLNKNR